MLPPGYGLGTDPDLLSLLRGDGSVVAFFSAAGAATGAIEGVAWEDYTGDRLPRTYRP